MIKINNKKVNKIIINGKEVKKVVIDGKVKYTNNTTPTLELHNTNWSLMGLGSTGTGSNYSSGVVVKKSTNQMNNIINQSVVGDTNFNYTHYVMELNRSISGEPNIPYSPLTEDATYIIPKLYVGPASGSFASCSVRIYDSTGTMLEQVDIGSISQGNLAQVQLTNPIVLSSFNDTFYIKAYGRKNIWGSNTWLNASVGVDAIYLQPALV